MENNSRIKSKRSVYISSILVFTGFIFLTSFVNIAYAAGNNPGCGLYGIGFDCDISGWMHLILGDVVIGALLAIFLHFLAHRSNIKLEANAVSIASIIKSNQTQRYRRKDFGIFNLKNLFNTLLHVEGQVYRAVMNFNKTMRAESNLEQREWKRRILISEIQTNELRLTRIINSIRSNLLAANDVLEPEVVNQIEGVCTYLSELYSVESLDGVMTLPKYQITKKKIHYIIEMLGTYNAKSHLFTVKQYSKPVLEEAA